MNTQDPYPTPSTGAPTAELFGDPDSDINDIGVELKKLLQLRAEEEAQRRYDRWRNLLPKKSSTKPAEHATISGQPSELNTSGISLMTENIHQYPEDVEGITLWAKVLSEPGLAIDPNNPPFDSKRVDEYGRPYVAATPASPGEVPGTTEYPSAADYQAATLLQVEQAVNGEVLPDYIKHALEAGRKIIGLRTAATQVPVVTQGDVARAA